MKRSVSIFLFLILFSVFWVKYGQAVSKMAQHVFEGETYYEKVGVTGGSNLGNPGYIVFQSTDGSGNLFSTYLWVSADNKLMLSSYPTITTNTSFPSGDWRSPNFVGTVVGGQS
jgi:hypothetical protein